MDDSLGITLLVIGLVCFIRKQELLPQFLIWRQLYFPSLTRGAQYENMVLAIANDQLQTGMQVCKCPFFLRRNVTDLH